MRPVVSLYYLIKSGSLLASTSSLPFDLTYVDNLGIIVSWSGSSPSGAISFMVSNDFAHSASFGSITQISGSVGSVAIVETPVPFNTIEVVYTSKTSDSGSISAVLWGSEP